MVQVRQVDPAGFKVQFHNVSRNGSLGGSKDRVLNHLVDIVYLLVRYGHESHSEEDD